MKVSCGIMYLRVARWVEIFSEVKYIRHHQNVAMEEVLNLPELQLPY